MSDVGPEQEHLAVYRRFRRVFGDGSTLTRDAKRRAKKKEVSSAPFGGGRDPHDIRDVMDALTSRLGWSSPLAQHELIADWAELVGHETAEHSRPIAIEDGQLTVSCDSTAWATQLRLMRSQLMTRVVTKYPDAGIISMRFNGPDAPSWKRGPRSIPGRGPRDTYG